jgi:hypothetical protein
MTEEQWITGVIGFVIGFIVATAWWWHFIVKKGE